MSSSTQTITGSSDIHGIDGMTMSDKGRDDGAQGVVVPANDRGGGGQENGTAGGMNSEKDKGRDFEAIVAWFSKVHVRCMTWQEKATQEQNVD
ncbi:hypothetical protein K466DRAFT_605790 [Polyporus arcularius HHB13444]|uniref:Uncharacterized protein n=1 Tax=Polyporus arcularius HHB13444 TaxID=1314778 RepID=A0A5C3NU31_9APHY|nr:hypothetical protein K466DRAFT_605790 [Polyporus arcularius HHB13444]